MGDVSGLLFIIIFCEAMYCLSQIQWIRTTVKAATGILIYTAIIFAVVVGLRALLAN